MERKNKKKINITDVGIVCSLIGIIASIILIIMNVIDKESITIGVVLLCSCSVNLIATINQKNRNKE